jgi:regulator of cell morphogenesis and NO signaling
MITQQQSVSSVVLEHPECAEVFQRHRIDFCCRGGSSVEAAAAEKGLEPAALVEALERAVGERSTPTAADPRALATPELVGLIVSRHHGYLRRALPFVRGLATKVRAAHGARNPKLRALYEAVHELGDELLAHLDDEEATLFPALTAKDVGAGAASTLLDAMIAEHLAVGESMARIRSAADDFTVPEWACTSYRLLASELLKLEADLFTHIHLENHVLAPRFTGRSIETRNDSQGEQNVDGPSHP